uniref:Uncharacterized protein n=1 Tax=Molossus molossus TaxID=27622 RepID=A0A7J8IA73_MOLMO|nr:hypothetical protein HJG59_010666 [Molossus molossus]
MNTALVLAQGQCPPLPTPFVQPHQGLAASRCSSRGIPSTFLLLQSLWFPYRRPCPSGTQDQVLPQGLNIMWHSAQETKASKHRCENTFGYAGASGETSSPAEHGVTGMDPCLPPGTGSQEPRGSITGSLANRLRGHQDTSLGQSIHKGAMVMPNRHLVPPTQKELEELRREKK